MLLVYEEAGDAPIRFCDRFFTVSPQMLDSGQLFWSAELTPAHALNAFIYQRSMRSTLGNVTFLTLFPMWTTFFSINVKLHTPATTPNTIVPIGQGDEIRPSRW